MEWVGEVPSTQRERRRKRRGEKATGRKCDIRWPRERTQPSVERSSVVGSKRNALIGCVVWTGTVPQRLVCLHSWSPGGDTV